MPFILARGDSLFCLEDLAKIRRGIKAAGGGDLGHAMCLLAQHLARLPYFYCIEIGYEADSEVFRKESAKVIFRYIKSLGYLLDISYIAIAFIYIFNYASDTAIRIFFINISIIAVGDLKEYLIKISRKGRGVLGGVLLGYSVIFIEKFSEKSVQPLSDVIFGTEDEGEVYIEASDGLVGEVSFQITFLEINEKSPRLLACGSVEKTFRNYHQVALGELEKAVFHKIFTLALDDIKYLKCAVVVHICHWRS